MVETGLKEWLKQDGAPSDFYQLIGQPRLSRNRDQILAGLETASEYLFHFQNHSEKNIRDRARTFQRQVAEARRTIADESRWDEYDQALIERLHGLFRENPELTKPNCKLDNLRRWLALVQHVDKARIEELISDWTARLSNEKPAGDPVGESETQTHAAGTRTEVMPRIRPIARSTDAGGAVSESSNNREPASTGSAKLPPLPRLESAEWDTTRPPPPPKPAKSSAFKAPVKRPQTPQPAPAALGSFARAPGGSAAALWIILAAFLTALALGIFALIIAWASGAFERNRAEIKSQIAPRYVESLEIKNSSRLRMTHYAKPFNSLENRLA